MTLSLLHSYVVVVDPLNAQFQSKDKIVKFHKVAVPPVSAKSSNSFA